jgi:hypothetical protein
VKHWDVDQLNLLQQTDRESGGYLNCRWPSADQYILRKPDYFPKEEVKTRQKEKSL